jgi:hypothetical protein
MTNSEVQPMKRSSNSAATLAAGLFGAIFAFVFLTTNDPDAMAPHMLSASKWLVLLPAAFLFAVRPSAKAWVSGLTIAGGIFVGTCMAAIVHGSNIWPIAGVYWTAVWTLPIAVGSAGGALVARTVRRPITK